MGPYLGQAPALDEPTPFAPGIVSTPLAERDLAMMPDGSEVYWSVVIGQYEYATILMSREVDGVWTEPEVAPCCTEAEYLHLEGCATRRSCGVRLARQKTGSGTPTG